LHELFMAGEAEKKHRKNYPDAGSFTVAATRSPQLA
jgi:hypothetical protein